MEAARQNELKEMKEILVGLMDRIAALEILDDPDVEDPGPVPPDAQDEAQEAEGPEAPDGILDGLLDKVTIIFAVLQRVNAVLAKEGNVVRPSVSLRLIAEAIDECQSYDIEPFANHVLAWNEVRRILEAAAVEVSGTQIDSEYAWPLPPVEADIDDVLSFIAVQAGEFESAYLHQLQNNRNSTFGELTPGECLFMLSYQMTEHTPQPGAHPGLFSMRHPTVAKWFAPMPWADWLRKALVTLAGRYLEPVGRPLPGPQGPTPYSSAGDQR